MSELSPEPSIPAAGADPGKRKAAAHEARGQTFAMTSAPAPIADMVEAMLSGGIPVEVIVLAEGTAELARGSTDPVAERRHASVASGEPREKLRRRKVSTHFLTPTDVFRARAEARAALYKAGELDLHEAVDLLQESAITSGLVDQIGQDAVQSIMAKAFERARNELG